PPAGLYGVGTCFGDRCDAIEAAIEQEGQRLVCWRDVPVEDAHVGRTARAAMPRIRQFVVAAEGLEGDAFERKLYVIRRVAELAAGPELVIPSLSSRTLVYKGMLTAPQLARFYPDLRDERFESALALVHSRFSTNTFPSWELAHPYRMIAHNGEINTLRGNVNWMRARESQLASDLFGDDLQKVLPVIRPAGSDTAMFDNVPERIVRKGRLQPGKLFLVDLDQHRIVPDDEVKRDVATRKPYAEWYADNVQHLSKLPSARTQPERPAEPLRQRQLLFGYAQ